MANTLVSLGHKLLSIPVCYDIFQMAVGSVRFRREFVKQEVSNFKMQTVMDLGCGTASTLDLLPTDVNYVGLDVSTRYLARAAKRNSKSNSKLILTDVSEKSWTEQTNNLGKTLGLALGVYHHLDDGKLEHTIQNLESTLETSSQIVSSDPIIDSQTTPAARWFAKNDRGKFIRSPEYYQEIFGKFGFIVTFKITRNDFRIPYDLLIMTATKVK